MRPSSLYVAIVLLLARQSTAVADIPDSLSSWLKAHPVSTKIAAPITTAQTQASLISTLSNRTLSPSVINSQRSRCPASCDDAGFGPSNWTVYHDVNRLAFCNQTMILDFNLYNSLDDPLAHASIRSCVASLVADVSDVATTTSTSCPLKRNQIQVQESMQIAFNQSDSSGSVDDFVAATQQLERYLVKKESECDATIAFAYSGSAAVGIFVGSGAQNVSADVLQQFITEVQSVGISESVLVQLCAGQNRSSSYSLGIIANANADLAFVQNAVQTWASGDCVTRYDSSNVWQNVTLSIPNIQSNATSLSSNATLSNSTTLVKSRVRALAPRADCTTVQVVSGDSCATLASECGITAAEFTEYNPSTTLCGSLTAGEHVCCSAGALPDFSPSPYTNGTCATYLVVTGDSCSALAATYSLTIDEIADFNNNTWGWMGCDDIQAGNAICLSSGDPPMPVPISGVVCGPQVPGTPVVPSGTNLSSLSQCPLNACCDIWGQCGTTAEFCTITESPTGAPGTAAAGTNGCISNCGTDIIIGDAPAEYINVGFFEGFNTDRPCLNEPLSSLDLSSYTHIHMSFGVITTDYDIDISAIQSSFDEFISMTGFKKIISVGGWAFCTDPSTYMLFREAVNEANRDTFAENIVAFLAKYDLDGINLDWEYPGEPDIPGIPAGTTDDGVNYAIFLDVLAAKMASTTEVSICAPASFWYLQGFLIQDMAEIIDYIIFMTYDVHGQWDYGGLFSDPGCDGGNCLRSDVNLTETINSLSMLTKAGVPSSQIVMGVTSYGRSFQMSTVGCYTEECTFTGPASGAYAGTCTETPGYIANAEINGIINANGSVLQADGDVLPITVAPLTYLDENSYSNIVVYDDTQWIGYMDDENKAARKILYQAYNLGGVSDWAIDLQSYTGDVSNSTSATVVSVDPSIWTSGDTSVPCEPPCIIVLPPYPLGFTETITWPTLTTTLLSLSAGSTLTVTTTISVPEFTITEISFQAITLSATDTSIYEINPVQSVTPSSFIFTLGPNEATFPPTAIPTTSASYAIGEGGGVGGASSSSTAVGGGGGVGGASSSSSSSTSVVPVAVASIIFYSTPVPVTIQPQPTHSITTPPLSTPIPTVTVSKGTPKSACKTNCGSHQCNIFGCKPDCGLFGCDGGCGIFGCGGGCGPLGCVGDCPLDICGGLNCIGGGCSSSTDDQNEDCDEPSTISACTFIVSSFSTSPMTEYSTTTKTHCATFVECSSEDSVTTTTETTSETQSTAEYISAYEIGYPSTADDAAISTLASSILSQRLALDKTRYSGLTVAPSTSTITVTATPTQSTSTTTSIVVVTPTADCAFWDEGWGYTFEVYNIEYWATDSGASLHKQEDGCGALTGWKWNPETSTTFAYAYFNLPFFFKDGCVERAIVSAGGPKLSCKGHGLAKRDAEAGSNQTSIGAVPPTYSEEQIAAFQSAYANSTTYYPYVGMNWTADATPVRNTTLVYVYVYTDPDNSS
ncbi:hypothetical protein OCU04_002702 [Sclerotinia nivalis]|uniref:chitinase n=1 Tax=Sclerotinia nivalis TaxID=352851 RepID=A0A9X0AU76_9HELO|nr:hypothetical protein OCU04_002702 [Sclerotinia nivalis]